MSPFEFVIPQSFLFLPANFSFVSFCFFISFIISKIFKSVIVFFILLISLLSVGYGDLFLKFAIKNYYELTQMDSTIYIYPTKNDGQKIDSLSISSIHAHPLKYSITLTSIEKDEIRVIHENYVERFIDITTYTNEYNKIISNVERVGLNNNKNFNTDEKAKFLIEKNTKTTFFSAIYSEEEYKFIDTTTKYILATAFKISFLIDNHKFRNRYLYWENEKEEEFNPSTIQNFDNIYTKMFIDDVRGKVK